MTKRTLANFVLWGAALAVLVGCEGCGKTPEGGGKSGGDSGSGGTPTAGVTVSLESRAVLTREDSVVDAGYGRLLYLRNCTPCHGYRSDGQGATATYLERKPRDLTDPNYMNTRTDDQIYEVLGGGGPKMKRSILMPAWGTYFTSYERKDLTAFLRTLHPRVGPEQVAGAADARLHYAVLTPEKEKDLGLTLTDAEHKFYFWHVYSEKAVGKPPDEAKLIGYAVFRRAALDAGNVTLALGFGKDLKLVSVAAHQRVVLVKGESRDETAVDTFLQQFKGLGAAELAAQAKTLKKVEGFEAGSQALFDTISKSASLLGPCLEKDQADYAALKPFVDPKNLPAPRSEGEKVYREKKCWECHGYLGNAKSLTVITTDPDPRDLTDGYYMKGISDDFIRVMLKEGGRFVNASETMPAYKGNVTPEQIEELIKFTRSLAVPQVPPIK